LLLLANLMWGLGCFSTNSAQQARLVAVAPALASVSIALNTSGMYAGQAIGSSIGGAVIAGLGLSMLPWAAAILMALALEVSRRAAIERAR
jgi:predicted MFS family arabinose efflux permease